MTRSPKLSSFRSWTFVLTALTVAGCGPSEPPPNIVLISIDSLRPDHLGTYGYARPTSPNLDRIAGEGIVFERAYSVTSWTLPAHLTMLSGLEPDVHGVVADGQRLSERVELLPETLGEHGYKSGAVVSGPYLNRRFGYDQGWQSYDDELVPADEIELRSREAAAIVSSASVHERATRFLDQFGQDPFFLFLHYFDVHYDYLPPPPWDRAFDPDYEGPIDGRMVANNLRTVRELPERDLTHLVALYDGEIGWVDHWLGELEKALLQRGLDRTTLLIVTADHGEEFLEHGRLGHRHDLYDTTVRVPLIVRLPDRRFAGTRISTPVGLVDLAPTIAAATRARLPRGASGQNLLSARFGKLRAPAGRDLFLSLELRDRGMVRDEWKLLARIGEQGEIEPSRVFLSHALKDPAEKRNAARFDREFTARLFVDLRHKLREFGERRKAHPPDALEASPEVDRQLRALGYL